MVIKLLYEIKYEERNEIENYLLRFTKGWEQKLRNRLREEIRHANDNQLMDIVLTNFGEICISIIENKTPEELEKFNLPARELLSKFNYEFIKEEINSKKLKEKSLEKPK